MTILMPSCLEKQEACPLTYTIEGHFYGDCQKLPIKGKTLYLYADVPRNTLLDTAVTDSTGYFSLKYSHNSVVFLKIHTKSTYEYYINIIEKIPQNTTYKDLDLYLYPSASLNVYLDVKNSYSELDTLVINNFTTEGFRLPGPFKSGFVLRIENAPLGDMSMFENHHRLGNYLLPYPGSPNRTNYTVTEYCADDVPVTIVLE